MLIGSKQSSSRPESQRKKESQTPIKEEPEESSQDLDNSHNITAPDPKIVASLSHEEVPIDLDLKHFSDKKQ